MVLVAHPALQRRPANPKQAWPVALEVASERPIQKLLRLVPRDRRMSKIELELSVDVREITLHQPVFVLHLLIERCAGYRRVQHELVKISVMRSEEHKS